MWILFSKMLLGSLHKTARDQEIDQSGSMSWCAYIKTRDIDIYAHSANNLASFPGLPRVLVHRFEYTEEEEHKKRGRPGNTYLKVDVGGQCPTTICV